MATLHGRWHIVLPVFSVYSLVLGSANGLAQPPPRAIPARPLSVAPPASKLGPAERMKPLTPLKPAPVGPAAQETGCVVLGDGRVFQGVVTELTAGYQIRTTQGSVVLPFAEIRTVAPSLNQAYIQIRESYTQPTANDHLDLGRWCEQNQLYLEASAEAQAALAVEPTRKEALSLLKKSEAALGRTPEPQAPAQKPAGQRPALGVAVVSPETQGEFNRHVLRLALNKCGNGTCHGAAALSPFKLLQGVRPDQNLQAILKYIDPENPAMSPLLVKARTVDGPHNGLFQGSKGTEQYARLLAWVEQAAQDQNQVAGFRQRPTERRQGGPIIMIRPHSEERPGLAGTPPPSSIEPPESTESLAPEIKTNSRNGTAPGSLPPRQAPLESDIVQKLLEDQAPDAFDPEEFNRLVHGTALLKEP